MSISKKVYFFVRTFPVLSQTFVLNQVKDLKDEGLDVHVLAVNPINDTSSVLSSIFGKDVNEKVTSILPEPHSKKSWIVMLLGALFCACAKRRWPIIGLASRLARKKNFFSAKDLLCLAWHLRNKNIVMENCIAHFGSNGVVLDYFRKAKLIDCENLFTVFHGYEISRYDQLKLWEEEYGKLGGKLLPISEHWAESLVSFGANKSSIEVVHMGVDVDTFSFSDKELSSPLQVLSVARATEKKGLKYAIDAILNSELDVHLTLIGDGKLLPSLRVMVEQHSNKSRITFLGACPPERVSSELKKTDLFLLPSVQDSMGDKEGIPVSLMEAMASGVIVLSTIHSGIPELIDDGVSGFLVPERDALAIQEKMKEIIKNPTLSLVRENARAKVDNEFNAATLSKQLLSLITK
ncbi:putative colanic acid biosynthesis glycosyltransferase WcaL [Alteromonas sp. KUL150]|uniref:glycosyltransferase n=1 Tax=Alteromonas sp. KUL150 TaxID=2480805 RepID=UPI0012E4C98F|nr:glycosyltransferase [Alteromonas sp. KUL150]GFD84053.1 putative colanic acid biosynthesis glycosyltransferase WcaL [Alteromonas sp. KUL150]